VHSAQERDESERTGTRPAYQNRKDPAASDPRRRLKFLAVVLVVSGLLVLLASLSRTTVNWATVSSAPVSFVAAAVFWSVASATKPSPLLVNTAIALAGLRVLVAFVVALTAYSSGISVLLSGLVLPVVVATYAIVSIRRIAEEAGG
jgi:hypothetical protein